MEKLIERFKELMDNKAAAYNTATKDRDKNYAHGAMLAYSAAIKITESALAKAETSQEALNLASVNKAKRQLPSSEVVWIQAQSMRNRADFDKWFEKYR